MQFIIYLTLDIQIIRRSPSVKRFITLKYVWFEVKRSIKITKCPARFSFALFFLPSTFLILDCISQVLIKVMRPYLRWICSELLFYSTVSCHGINERFSINKCQLNDDQHFHDIFINQHSTNQPFLFANIRITK